jgi:hypothetical protein
MELFLGTSIKEDNKAPIFQRFLIASICKKQIGEPTSNKEELEDTSSMPSF